MADIQYWWYVILITCFQLVHVSSEAASNAELQKSFHLENTDGDSTMSYAKLHPSIKAWAEDDTYAKLKQSKIYHQICIDIYMYTI